MDYKLTIGALLLALSAGLGAAHEVAYSHVHGDTNPAVPMNSWWRKKVPSKLRPKQRSNDHQRPGLLEICGAEGLGSHAGRDQKFFKGAHGTIIVDHDRDIVYWGLEKVGWVAFSNRMSKSWVVKGDSHGLKWQSARRRYPAAKGQLPLVVAADNVEHEVYVSDTSFTHAQKLDWPEGGPYTKKGEFNPTDAAFVGAGDIWVTDGYGKHYFMPAKSNPLKYTGTFYGGENAFSNTPHGITYNPDSKSLLVSARPEAMIKEYSLSKKKWLEGDGPSGWSPCV